MHLGNPLLGSVYLGEKSSSKKNQQSTQSGAMPRTFWNLPYSLLVLGSSPARQLVGTSTGML